MTVETSAGHGFVRPHTVTSVRGDRMDVEPITEVPTRQDILDAIRYMTDTAKTLRRQGYVAALDLEAIIEQPTAS